MTSSTIVAGGILDVTPFPHPQGCRTWLVRAPDGPDALAIDVHLDLVSEVAAHVEQEGLQLRYVVDTHTHADHPSGSAALAEIAGAERVAHKAGGHRGVGRHPEDGESLPLGSSSLLVRHAPGHTPDHIVLIGGGRLFAGDTLLIGSVARTDFLGGDAGQLFDTLRKVVDPLPPETVLHPGHDYQGRLTSTLRQERDSNPWLRIAEKTSFVRQLTANPPPRPANMDTLLRWNREGDPMPGTASAVDLAAFVAAGGAGSVIDVRTPVEWNSMHVEGAVNVPLDRIPMEIDRVRLAPAPRMLMCNTGRRAKLAREQLDKAGVGGLIVVEASVQEFRSAGGAVAEGAAGMSLERQVRIAAGSLVLAGTALGAFVHPGFLAVPAFVGSGLVFAGLTDWCGMGLFLARMPWNRGGSGAGGAAPASCAASAPSACAASAPSSCAAGSPGETP